MDELWQALAACLDADGRTVARGLRAEDIGPCIEAGLIEADPGGGGHWLTERGERAVVEYLR